MVEHLGGQRIYAARHADPSTIAAVTGERVARALANLFGGEQITIPTCSRLLCMVRHVEIYRLRMAGMRRNALA